MNEVPSHAALYSFLTMTAGTRVGVSFVLDPTDETTIGRGTDCTIVVNDPLCSRVHARLAQDPDGWRIRDAKSRNGTFVGGQRISEAVVTQGVEVRIGSTEFIFQQAEQPPTVGFGSEASMTQTIVRDLPMETDGGLPAPHVQDLSDLYDLSVELIGTEAPEDVERIVVERLLRRTSASIAGFLWANDEGDLRPRLILPDDGDVGVHLSEELTRLVCRRGHAVWAADQRGRAAGRSPEHFADAICVPLRKSGATLGALHLYLAHGRFSQSDFDFAVSLARIAVVALARARRHSTMQVDYEQLLERTPGHEEMVGESPPMRELKDRIRRLAQATGCVLVRGESGVGKELVARALHRASPRADRPMLCVNCAAVPADLMESQLFGHKAGAFTGADRDHVGYFQQADAGTLFLDEIGEMTLDGQAKLLRILEGHSFQRVGGVEEIRVDVRVIAATNRDLQKYVQEKKFREDLYYRLCVFELTIPPLRERAGDIELLVNFFFEHYKRRHGRPRLTLSEGARKKLLQYAWPGNVRQLSNVMDSAVVLSDGPEVQASDLELRAAVNDDDLNNLCINHWERKLIAEALRRTRGAVPQAAKLLGVSRATLYRKIEEYDIPR